MTIDREELRRLCEAATPGPWEAEFGHDGAFVYMPGTPAAFFGDSWQHGDNGGISVDLNSAGLVSDVDRRNVEFIAASRTALPALLDTLEALEKVVGGVVIGLGSTRFMDPPDGGAPSLGEQVERMRLALEAAEAKHDSDHNLISSLQWQVECDRKIATEWKQRAEAAEARERSIRALLSKVAAIAHCGGLADLDTFSALIEIRKLTLSAWDNSGSVQEQRNRVLLALAETAP